MSKFAHCQILYQEGGSSLSELCNDIFDLQIFQHTKEDRVPVISVNSVYVEENTGVVITNSSLNVLDLDTPENEIVLTIIKKPSYGLLLSSYSFWLCSAIS